LLQGGECAGLRLGLRLGVTDAVGTGLRVPLELLLPLRRGLELKLPVPDAATVATLDADGLRDCERVLEPDSLPVSVGADDGGADDETESALAGPVAEPEGVGVASGALSDPAAERLGLVVGLHTPSRVGEPDADIEPLPLSERVWVWDTEAAWLLGVAEPLPLLLPLPLGVAVWLALCVLLCVCDPLGESVCDGDRAWLALGVCVRLRVVDRAGVVVPLGEGLGLQASFAAATLMPP
jgi:hypothetical protein